MEQTEPRALRVDAARNRARLLEAAGDLFAARGLGVSLNDIAAHAGVGVGTAYRRFANKEEVIDALFEERLDALAATARAALEDRDPWSGLVRFLTEALQQQFGDRGLRQVMTDPSLGEAKVARARDDVAPLLEALVARARDAGVIRPDLEQTDLIFLQVGLAAIMDSSRSVEPDLYRRYLTLVLDAIRADRSESSPLPVAALDAAATHRAMTRGAEPAG